MESDRPIAIVDIDGVVADVRHRLHHITRRPKDWDAFFDAAVDDPPREEALPRDCYRRCAARDQGMRSGRAV